MNAPDTYKVISYYDWDGIPIPSTSREHYYRWYWQANAASFLRHWIMGANCNTYRKLILPQSTNKSRVNHANNREKILAQRI